MRSTVVLGLAMAMAFSCAADANILTNGSFEDAGNSHKIGWSFSGNASVSSYGSSTYNGGASDGSWAIIANSGNNTPNAVISQAFATIIGKTYQLTFDIGKYINSSGAAQAELRVIGLGDLINTTVSDPVGSGGANDPLEYADFTHVSFLFTADSTSTTLQLTDTSTNGGLSFDLVLDNFVVTAIPEPATFALAAAGVLLLARRRR